MFEKSGCKLNHYQEGQKLMKFFDLWLQCYKESCAFFTLQMSLGKEYSPTKIKQTLSTILGLISVYCIKVPARFQIPVNL